MFANIMGKRKSESRKFGMPTEYQSISEILNFLTLKELYCKLCIDEEFRRG